MIITQGGIILDNADLSEDVSQTDPAQAARTLLTIGKETLPTRPQFTIGYARWHEERGQEFWARRWIDRAFGAEAESAVAWFVESPHYTTQLIVIEHFSKLLVEAFTLVEESALRTRDVSTEDESKLKVNDSIAYSSSEATTWERTCIMQSKTDPSTKIVVSGHGGRIWFLPRTKSLIVSLIERISIPRVPEKGLELVHWTRETEHLRNDVSFFLANKPWFTQRELAYRRSYLLYGPPGNGKSTTIQAIATEAWTRNGMGRSGAFDFSNQNFHDRDFIEYMQQCARNVVVFEDIDRWFVKGENHTNISMSAILNALDGAYSEGERIVIATANRPSIMDHEVLCRPGRFDLRVQFSCPTREDGAAYLKSLLKHDNVSSELCDEVAYKCTGQSFAFLKNVMNWRA